MIHDTKISANILNVVAWLMSLVSWMMEYSPVIIVVLTIISLAVAIGVNLYRLFSQWKGFTPWKTKK